MQFRRIFGNREGGDTKKPQDFGKIISDKKNFYKKLDKGKRSVLNFLTGHPPL